LWNFSGPFLAVDIRLPTAFWYSHGLVVWSKFLGPLPVPSSDTAAPELAVPGNWGWGTVSDRFFVYGDSANVWGFRKRPAVADGWLGNIRPGEGAPRGSQARVRNAEKLDARCGLVVLCWRDVVVLMCNP